MATAQSYIDRINAEIIDPASVPTKFLNKAEKDATLARLNQAVSNIMGIWNEVANEHIAKTLTLNDVIKVANVLVPVKKGIEDIIARVQAYVLPYDNYVAEIAAATTVAAVDAIWPRIADSTKAGELTAADNATLKTLSDDRKFLLTLTHPIQKVFLYTKVQNADGTYTKVPKTNHSVKLRRVTGDSWSTDKSFPSKTTDAEGNASWDLDKKSSRSIILYVYNPNGDDWTYEIGACSENKIYSHTQRYGKTSDLSPDDADEEQEPEAVESNPPSVADFDITVVNIDDTLLDGIGVSAYQEKWHRTRTGTTDAAGKIVFSMGAGEPIQFVVNPGGGGGYAEKITQSAGTHTRVTLSYGGGSGGTTTSVTVNVNVDGASVKVFDGGMQLDSKLVSGGKAVFTLATGKSLTFKASKTGYTEDSKTVTISGYNQSVRLDLSALPTAKTITFVVTNADGLYVKDASVLMDGTTHKTDLMGKTTFSVMPGTYLVNITASGYNDLLNQSVEVSTSDRTVTATLVKGSGTPQSTTNIIFQCNKNDTNNTVVAGANASVYSVSDNPLVVASGTTDALGKVSFALAAANYKIVVKKSGYDDYQMYFEMPSDTPTMNIVMAETGTTPNLGAVAADITALAVTGTVGQKELTATFTMKNTGTENHQFCIGVTKMSPTPIEDGYWMTRFLNASSTFSNTLKIPLASAIAAGQSFSVKLAIWGGYVKLGTVDDTGQYYLPGTGELKDKLVDRSQSFSADGTPNSSLSIEKITAGKSIIDVTSAAVEQTATVDIKNTGAVASGDFYAQVSIIGITPEGETTKVVNIPGENIKTSVGANATKTITLKMPIAQGSSSGEYVGAVKLYRTLTGNTFSDKLTEDVFTFEVKGIDNTNFIEIDDKLFIDRENPLITKPTTAAAYLVTVKNKTAATKKVRVGFTIMNQDFTEYNSGMWCRFDLGPGDTLAFPSMQIQIQTNGDYIFLARAWLGDDGKGTSQAPMAFQSYSYGSNGNLNNADGYKTWNGVQTNVEWFKEGTGLLQAPDNFVTRSFPFDSSILPSDWGSWWGKEVAEFVDYNQTDHRMLPPISDIAGMPGWNQPVELLAWCALSAADESLNFIAELARLTLSEMSVVLTGYDLDGKEVTPNLVTYTSVALNFIPTDKAGVVVLSAGGLIIPASTRAKLGAQIAKKSGKTLADVMVMLDGRLSKLNEVMAELAIKWNADQELISFVTHGMQKGVLPETQRKFIYGESGQMLPAIFKEFDSAQINQVTTYLSKLYDLDPKSVEAEKIAKELTRYVNGIYIEALKKYPDSAYAAAIGMGFKEANDSLFAASKSLGVNTGTNSWISNRCKNIMNFVFEIPKNLHTDVGDYKAALNYASSADDEFFSLIEELMRIESSGSSSIAGLSKADMGKLVNFVLPNDLSEKKTLGQLTYNGVLAEYERFLPKQVAWIEDAVEKGKVDRKYADSIIAAFDMKLAMLRSTAFDLDTEATRAIGVLSEAADAASVKAVGGVIRGIVTDIDSKGSEIATKLGVNKISASVDSDLTKEATIAGITLPKLPTWSKSYSSGTWNWFKGLGASQRVVFTGFILKVSRVTAPARNWIMKHQFITGLLLWFMVDNLVQLKATARRAGVSIGVWGDRILDNEIDTINMLKAYPTVPCESIYLKLKARSEDILWAKNNIKTDTDLIAGLINTFKIWYGDDAPIDSKVLNNVIITYQGHLYMYRQKCPGSTELPDISMIAETPAISSDGFELSAISLNGSSTQINKFEVSSSIKSVSAGDGTIAVGMSFKLATASAWTDANWIKLDYVEGTAKDFSLAGAITDSTAYGTYDLSVAFWKTFDGGEEQEDGSFKGGALSEEIAGLRFTGKFKFDQNGISLIEGDDGGDGGGSGDIIEQGITFTSDSFIVFQPEIIDGDTVKGYMTDADGKTHHVNLRLLGMDAPELQHTKKNASTGETVYVAAEPFSKESKEWLAKMLGQDDQFTVFIDRTNGKYSIYDSTEKDIETGVSRILSWLVIKNSSTTKDEYGPVYGDIEDVAVSVQSVRRGWARAMVVSPYASNKWVDAAALTEAQEFAKTNKLGIWSGGFGTIAVRSTPSNAKIFRNSTDTGLLTASTFTLAPATYKFYVVFPDGRQSADQSIILQSGETKQIVFTQEATGGKTKVYVAASTQATATIAPKTVTAGIYLNDVYQEVFTPQTLELVDSDWPDLKPGTSIQVPLRLEAEGYQTLETIIRIVQGISQSYEFTMQPLEDVAYLDLSCNVTGAEADVNGKVQSLPYKFSVPAGETIKVEISAKNYATKEYSISALDIGETRKLVAVLEKEDSQAQVIVYYKGQKGRVYLNNKDLGLTPSDNKVEPGTYTLKVTSEGYSDFILTDLKFEANNVYEYLANFSAEQKTTSTLYIQSNVKGASIYLKDSSDASTYYGTTPQTLTGLAPGVYNVALSKTGYISASLDVTLEAGKTVSRYLDLDTAAAGLATISITSAPTAADVEITRPDGTILSDQVTPIKLTGVAAGAWNIKISKKDYVAQTGTITVSELAGRLYEKHFILLTETEAKNVVTGKLKVTSYPSYAEVFLTDPEGITKSYGYAYSGKIISELVPGTYTAVAKKDGYLDVTKSVTVIANKTIELNFELKTAEQAETKDKGSLKVSSSPTYATVFMNGVNIGYSGSTFTGLLPGDYNIRLEKDGYVPQSKVVSIVIGKTTSAAFVLKSTTAVDKEGKTKVVISSYPTGAAVFINGESTGLVTPATTYLLADDYTVSLTKDGYSAEPKQLSIEGGAETAQLYFNLTKQLVPAGKGLLKITSKPVGATITINEVNTGKVTPEDFIREPGDYTIKLEKLGYVTFTGTFTLPADDYIEINQTLVKLSGTSAQRGENEYDTETGATTKTNLKKTYTTPSGWVFSTNRETTSGSDPGHTDVTNENNPYATADDI